MGRSRPIDYQYVRAPDPSQAAHLPPVRGPGDAARVRRSGGLPVLRVEPGQSGETRRAARRRSAGARPRGAGPAAPRRRRRRPAGHAPPRTPRSRSFTRSRVLSARVRSASGPAAASCCATHCGVRVLVHGEGGLSRWLFPQTVDQTARARRGRAGGSRTIRASRGRPGTRRSRQRQLWCTSPSGSTRPWSPAGSSAPSCARSRTSSSDDEGNERLELALAEERFEDPHLQERRFFQAAATSTALGATRPRFSGRELLLPLVAGEVDPSSTVMEPQGTAAEIAEQGPQAGAPAGERRRRSAHPDAHPAGGGDPALLPALAGGLPGGGPPVPDRRRRARRHASTPATAPAARRAAHPRPGCSGWRLCWSWPSSRSGLGSRVGPAVRVPIVFLAVIVCVAAILLVLRSPAGGKVEYHEPFSS